jgi:GNAT superfamily N-acetyltransferase
LKKVFLLDESRIEDRLFVCFGHIPNWKTKTVVEDVRAWTRKRLKDARQFCYVAYENEEPVGFIEFLPMKAIEKCGLNPCRMSPLAGKEAKYKGKELVDLPYPSPILRNDVFIACLWVKLPFVRRGIGRALAERVIHDIQKGRILSDSKVEGLQVYIEKRRRDWHPSIDWPAGSTTFYEKMGFTKIKDIKIARMTGCVMRKVLNDGTQLLQRNSFYGFFANG